MATIAKLQNFALKNKSIMTAYGKYAFNNEGIIFASKLSKELLNELITIPGFIPLDKGNNIITDLSDTIETEPEIKSEEILKSADTQKDTDSNKL